MVSPTTLPAASSARSATWPRTSASARMRSASMSATACSRSARSPPGSRRRPARGSRRRALGARRGSRSASRRASARTAWRWSRGLLAIAAGGVGVLEALLDAVAPRRSRLLRRPRSRGRPSRRCRRRQEVGRATRIQKRLMVSPPLLRRLPRRSRDWRCAGQRLARARTSTAAGSAGYSMKIASRPTTIASTPRPSANAARMIARPRIWLGGVGVAADGAGGHAGQDADADAGADDAEGGEACADGAPCRLISSSASVDARAG